MFCQESLGEIKCGAFLKRARPQILSIQSADYLINGLLIVWLQRVGGGGFRAPENSRGEGGLDDKNHFPRGLFRTQYKNCSLLIW